MVGYVNILFNCHLAAVHPSPMPSCFKENKVKYYLLNVVLLILLFHHSIVPYSMLYCTLHGRITAPISLHNHLYVHLTLTFTVVQQTIVHTYIL